MNGSNRFTFLVGGEAGHGVKRAGTVAAELFAESGRYTFEYDDYQSLIRGGHNFSVVTSSVKPVFSQYLHADVVVALDARSYRLHHDHVAKSGLLVYNSDVVKDADSGAIGLPLSTLAKGYTLPGLRLGVGSVAVLMAACGFGRDETAELIRKKYPHDADNNVAYGLSVYDVALPAVGSRYVLAKGKAPATMLTGNEAIGLGAYAGGLDMYFAYPMTPASSILHFLAAHAKDFGIAVVHPESEIAVMNMAIGAASAGAHVVVGSSGGGFALMEEAMSLAGMAEVPLLCALSSRPGPSTGVPTYTGQADLSFALNQGHGEFPRIVASPGTVEEAYYLSAELMELAWAYQVPAIVLTEKHLSESRMTVDLSGKLSDVAEPVMDKGRDEYHRYAETPDGVSPLRFFPSSKLIKWTSYEHDELGISTEDAGQIVRMQDKRLRKARSLEKAIRGMKTVKHFGSGGPVIVTYGSTVMSVLEALSSGDIEAEVLQIVYLAPFPVWEFASLSGRDVIVVEQSSTAQLAALLQRETDVTVRSTVTQYDGRPFDPEELAVRLKEVVAHG
ncbi:MAG: 2-oxoacid:acceptor oxidoreductase subunit alpha [Dehalococcoidia bacterium]|nr:2-oxoacid:acceptor oxidoreductase subunit alpha [Dehalococcoidia bacterium]